MQLKPGSTLLALTAAALAIPGMARAEDARVDYRYSNYREDPIAADKTSNADRQRYEVQSHQFRIEGKPGDTLDLSADLTVETMSGATPWFILPDANGKPIQVMSGATVEDKRADGLLKATRKFDWGTAAISGGYSGEEDYTAINGGLEGSVDFNDKLGTISAGAGYSSDKVDPTDGGSTRFPDRITHATRKSWTAFGGVSYVLGADAVIQSTFAYSRDSGYLSDPYKLAYVQTNTVQDSRPDGRKRIAWLTRLRYALPSIDAALHADYRLYSDDWEVQSHTVEGRWLQSLPGGFTVTPGVRWYSQSQAYFYAPYYGNTRRDRLYSSDYRLSPYGALAYSVALDKQFGSWGVGLRYENYQSKGDYAAGSVEVENPGLVDFKTFSASIRKVF
jgi:hypothetical protein